MRKCLVAKAALIGLFFITPQLIAAPQSAEDRAQDIQITSDAFEYNHPSGVATYSGNVIAIQGSREIAGEKLKVFTDSAGKIEKIIVYGKPATHHSLTAPNKPMFNAQANTIVYETIEQELTLIGQARVEQGGDIYEAPRIQYDITQKIVRSPESGQGRTTITLKPRE